MAVRLGNGASVQHSVFPDWARPSGSRMQGPVLGIVLDLRYPDDPANRSKQMRSSATGPTAGRAIECMVLVVQAVGESFFILPNCVVAHRRTGSTKPEHGGNSEYSEEYPTPCTRSEADRVLRSAIGDVDPYALTGDWVLVDFIGGSIHRPVIRGWYPHPLGDSELPKRVDGQRVRRRHRGTTFTIDDAGNASVEHRSGHTVSVSCNEVRVTHSSGSSFTIDKDGNITTHAVGHVHVLADKEVVIDSPSKVSLGEEAVQSALLGENVTTYVNNLKVPSPFGPLGGPIQPMGVPGSPGFPHLSQLVKVEK